MWVPRNISSVAHPTRQAIIQCLEKGPKTAVDLEKELKESRYNLYHHLKTLKDQGFIKEKLEGRMKVYELETDQKNAEDLGDDVDNLTQVQQTLTLQSISSVAQSSSGSSGGKSMELEVKGDVLNRMLEEAGEKKVAKTKRYQLVIVESPPKAKKKGKKK